MNKEEGGGREENGNLEDDGDGNNSRGVIAFRGNEFHSFECTAMESIRVRESKREQEGKEGEEELPINFWCGS
jgi:hypothetical protein